MNRFNKFCWSLLAAAGLAGLAIITPSARGDVAIHIDVGGPPAPRPVIYHYEYYPDAEVYYVPETRVYWYMSDGVWVSGPAVPVGIELGARVRLDVDAREPWRHHEVIVNRYPGHHHGEGHWKGKHKDKD